MSEILSNKDRVDVERLTTADIANRSRSAAEYPDQEISEEAPLMPEEEISSEDATALPTDRGPFDRVPSDRAASDNGRADQFAVDSEVDTRNDLPHARPAVAASEPAQTGALFAQDELNGYRARWTTVQTSFVDEPRRAVEQADSLVANVVTRIAEQFAAEREQLEKQWDRGDEVNTEDLRQALKRYRAFFDRLLAF
ncbi:MAG: hypothetical protein WAL75_26220 [Terracidiphilus sp.]